jgi:hypothetical protein
VSNVRTWNCGHVNLFGLAEVAKTYRTLQDVYLDEHRHRRLLDASRRYVETVNVYFAPVTDNRLAQVERVLLYHLNPTMTTWGTVSRPTINLAIRNRSAPWVGKVSEQQLPELVTQED